MIFRKWTGRVRTADSAAYVDYVEATGAAHYAATPGNLGYQILLRELGDGTSEISTISWWTDYDAVRAYAGEDYQRAAYYSEDDQYLVERPEFVEHHEVTIDHRKPSAS